MCLIATVVLKRAQRVFDAGCVIYLSIINCFGWLKQNRVCWSKYTIRAQD